MAQLAYLAVRFRWTYAAAALTAMVHDVVILLGVFAWLGKTIDGVFLAALLTVIGYSVNDTVVIFDRIRELRRSRPREPLLVGILVGTYSSVFTATPLLVAIERRAPAATPTTTPASRSVKSVPRVNTRRPA